MGVMLEETKFLPGPLCKVRSLNHNMHCTSSRKGGTCSNSQVEHGPPSSQEHYLGLLFPRLHSGQHSSLHAKGASGHSPWAVSFPRLCPPVEATVGCFLDGRLGQVHECFSLRTGLRTGEQTHCSCSDRASWKSWEEKWKFKGLCRYQGSQKYHVSLSPLYLKEHKQALQAKQRRGESEITGSFLVVRNGDVNLEWNIPTVA